MKLAFSNSLLGEYDYLDNTTVHDRKPFYQKIGIIAIIIIAIIAINVIGSCIGTCASGCNKCGSSSSSSSGCSSSSSSSSSYHYDTKYAYVYNNVNGEVATFSQDIYKKGCSKSSGSWYGSFSTINSNYYELEGYYKDQNYSKSISIADFSDGKTYYAKFVEKGLGNLITFGVTSNLPSKYGSSYGVESFSAKIGENMPSVVNYNTPAGYAFQGVYTKGSNGVQGHKIYDESGNIVSTYSTLHSSTFGVSSGTVSLIAVYAPEEYTLTIYYGNGNTPARTIAVHYDDMVYDDYLKEIIDSLNARPRTKVSMVTDYYGIELKIGDLSSQRITQSVSYRIYVDSTMEVRYVFNVSGVDDVYVESKADEVYYLVMPTSEQSKPGYTFAGWFTDDSFSGTQVSYVLLDQDKTVYAKWNPNQYTISYKSSLDNHSLMSGSYETSDYSQQFKDTAGNVLTLEAFGEEKGYSIIGYRIGEEEGLVNQIPAKTYGDLVVYVVYSSKEIAVNLDSGSGVLVSANYNPTIKYGQTFKLEVPTGFAVSKEFKGWYYGTLQVTDEAGNSLITFDETSLGISYASLSSVQFTAMIKTKEFTINFYDHGTKVDSKTVKYGEKVSTTYTPLPEIGEEFSAWSESSASLVKFDLNIQSITNNYDLYAYYIPRAITVTLDPGSGALSQSQRTLIVSYGQKFTAAIPSFAEQYKFEGYYLLGTTTAVTNAYGNSLAELTHATLGISYEELCAGIVLEAKRSMKTYTVEYYRNNVLIGSETVNHGETVANVPEIIPSQGKVFKYWSVDSSGSLGFDLSTLVKKDYKLYPVFDDAMITVKLSVATGGYISNTQKSVQYNKQVGLGSPTYSDPKYEFVGWYFGDTKVTNDLGVLSVPFIESTFNMTYDDFLANGVTLTEHRQVKQLTVEFYEGSELLDSLTVAYGDSVVPTVTPSAHEGYTLQSNWSTSPTKYNAFNLSNAITQNMSLYAFYSPIFYTVHLQTEKGSISTTDIQVAYDNPFNVQVPTYTGENQQYEFVGYFYNTTKVVNASGVSTMVFNTTNLNVDIAALEAGITLVEEYKVRQFTVTFMNGSVNWATKTVNYGETVTAASTPEAPSGYFFKGWTTSYQGSSFFNFDTTQIVKDWTLYAKFDNSFKVELYDTDKETLLKTINVYYGQTWSLNYYYNNDDFLGWYDTDNDTKVAAKDGVIYPAYQTYNFERDLKLYAKLDTD